MRTGVDVLKAAASGFSGPPRDSEQLERLLSPSRLAATLWSLLPMEYKYGSFSYSHLLMI
jgi:hypothetical protein